MALPITIPYTFANATSSIPLSNLDSDFTTVVNAINGIGNGTNSLSNVSITGGSIDNVAIGSTTTSTGKFTTITATTGNITTINATTLNAATHRSDTSLTFQTNGTTTAMTIDTSQNVGIGTSSPSSKLHLSGTDASPLAVRLQNTTATTGNTYTLASGNNGYFYISRPSVADYIVIDTNGNVGIGTGSPATKVHALTASATSVAFRAGNSVSYAEFQVDASGNSQLLAPGGIQIFNTNGSERMRIDSSGNVGIGTTNPTSKLVLYTNSATSVAINFGNSVNSWLAGIDSSGNYSFYTNGAYNVYFSTNGTERMRIDSSGNVGIGTSSPAQKLHVNGNAILGGNPAAQWSNVTVSSDVAIQSAAPLLNFVNAAGSSRFGYLYHTGTAGSLYLLNQEAGALLFGTNNTEQMRINSSGNVGIGTSSPNASAILDAQSTTKGVRFPNMTTTQKNAI